jgi:hypothetical protein
MIVAFPIACYTSMVGALLAYVGTPDRTSRPPSIRP